MTDRVYSRSGENWPAPISTSPIVATVSIPGSKSLTNRELVLAALSLRNRYNLSHWDAAILCAAARLGAHTVISEDLSHGQRYDGICVLNPFLG